MAKTGVPYEKIEELERKAFRINEAKNHHLCEWRRLLHLLRDQGYITPELFNDLMDSLTYVDGVLLESKADIALIQRHARKIYADVPDERGEQ